MNSGCAAALDRLQDFCFMAIKAANREPCTPPRSTLILTPAFEVYTELGIDPGFPPTITINNRSFEGNSLEPRYLELNLSRSRHEIPAVVTAAVFLALFIPIIPSCLRQLLRFGFQQAIQCFFDASSHSSFILLHV